MTETKLTFSWCKKAEEVPSLSAFFAENVTPEYISHSELQGCRAVAPGKWRPDLDRVLADEMLERVKESAQQGSDRTIDKLVASASDDGKIVAVSYVSFYPTAPTPYAILEDIVVARDMRGRGVGAAVLGWLVTQCRSRGVKRIFLESGVGNHQAHEFFDRHGFKQCSVVMMRDL